MNPSAPPAGGREGRARRLLVDGNVDVRSVQPGRIAAVVQGIYEPHEVAFTDGTWSCSCPATGWRCIHVRSVWRVCQSSAVGTPPVTPTRSTTHTEENHR